MFLLVLHFIFHFPVNLSRIESHMAHQSRDHNGRFITQSPTESPTASENSSPTLSSTSSLPLSLLRSSFSPPYHDSPPSSPIKSTEDLPAQKTPPQLPAIIFPIINMPITRPVTRTMQTITMFYGDNRDDENPQDFFKNIKGSFDNLTLNTAQMCTRFRCNCRSGFDAEEWFDALDATDKATWELFTIAFNLRWPTIKSTKSSAEKKAELFAEQLNKEQLLKKVECRGGISAYTHVVWADRIQRLAAEVGDPSGLLISVVHANLPQAIRDIVGDEHASCAAFATAIRGISTTALRTAIEKEQCFRNLEHIKNQNTPQSPTAAIRLALNRTTFASPPPSPSPQRISQRIMTPAPTQTAQPPNTGGNDMPRTRLFAYHQNTQPVPLPASAFREARVHLIHLQRNSLTHHPDTDLGRMAYRCQVEEYNRKYGITKADEYRPYLLTPGTEAPSMGACFNCGKNVLKNTSHPDAP